MFGAQEVTEDFIFSALLLKPAFGTAYFCILAKLIKQTAFNPIFSTIHTHFWSVPHQYEYSQFSKA
jgi:hypothetical protein